MTFNNVVKQRYKDILQSSKLKGDLGEEVVKRGLSDYYCIHNIRYGDRDIDSLVVTGTELQHDEQKNWKKSIRMTHRLFIDKVVDKYATAYPIMKDYARIFNVPSVTFTLTISYWNPNSSLVEHIKDSLNIRIIETGIQVLNRKEDMEKAVSNFRERFLLVHNSSNNNKYMYLKGIKKVVQNVVYSQIVKNIKKLFKVRWKTKFKQLSKTLRNRINLVYTRIKSDKIISKIKQCINSSINRITKLIRHIPQGILHFFSLSYSGVFPSLKDMLPRQPIHNKNNHEFREQRTEKKGYNPHKYNERLSLGKANNKNYQGGKQCYAGPRSLVHSNFNEFINGSPLSVRKFNIKFEGGERMTEIIKVPLGKLYVSKLNNRDDTGDLTPLKNSIIANIKKGIDPLIIPLLTRKDKDMYEILKKV